MKVPGRAWLEMRAEPLPGGRSRYTQKALFVPRGLGGHVYWASVAPFHGVVFSGMARNITRGASERPPGSAGPGSPATPRTPADSAR
jgi:hypothetical protein